MKMTQTDHKKLLAAGFTIIRRDYVAKTVKCRTAERFDWHRLAGPFVTKSAVDQRMLSYLKNKNIVED